MSNVTLFILKTVLIGLNTDNPALCRVYTENVQLTASDTDVILFSW